MTLASGIGANLKAAHDMLPEAWWFGEDQGRYVVTLRDVARFETFYEAKLDRSIRYVGKTGSSELALGASSVKLTALREASDSFFRDWMEN
jgi:phosphoribosylformylglycinamidine synthase